MTNAPRSRWVHAPVAQRADGAWIDDALRAVAAGGGLQRDVAGREQGPRERIELFRGTDPDAEVNTVFYRRGWTDGLPVVAPTVGRVREMLRFCDESAATALGELDPMRGVATPERIAANAVMAGCDPKFFPVVMAAVRGIVEPSFNLRGVQMTDENVTPLVIISGPLTRTLDINGGIGALGPGWQANATIGRALRLVMNNIGGGWPGTGSLAGIGQPGRYTLCVAENLEASPWPGLHVEAGLDPEQSTVTLLRAECSINVTGELEEIASVMASAASIFSVLHGGHVAVLLAPATAIKMQERGWSKHEIARFLFERGRIPLEVWRSLWVRRRVVPGYGLPTWVSEAEQQERAIPVVESAERIVIFVAGGDAPIPQHVYFPTWGFPACRLTLPIRLPRDWHALCSMEPAS